MVKDIESGGIALFLDFDGVLHSANDAVLDANGRLLKNGQHFEWLPLLVTVLAPFSDVGIIVSSDWRRLFDDNALVKLLGPLGPRFVGVVETSQRRGLAGWLALDDHPSVVKAGKKDGRFVACEPDTGFSSLTVQAELRQKLGHLQQGLPIIRRR